MGVLFTLKQHTFYLFSEIQYRHAQLVFFSTLRSIQIFDENDVPLNEITQLKIKLKPVALHPTPSCSLPASFFHLQLDFPLAKLSQDSKFKRKKKKEKKREGLCKGSTERGKQREAYSKCGRVKPLLVKKSHSTMSSSHDKLREYRTEQNKKRNYFRFFCVCFCVFFLGSSQKRHIKFDKSLLLIWRPEFKLFFFLNFFYFLQKKRDKQTRNKI